MDDAKAHSFRTLFEAYAGDGSSIVDHLYAAEASARREDPVLWLASDAIYAFAGGQLIKRILYREPTHGLIPLLAVAQLGAALGSLVYAANLNPQGDWEPAAQRLAIALKHAKGHDSRDFWDTVGVAAWEGRAERIHRMLCYGLRHTLSYLRHLDSENRDKYLKFSTLRREYLEDCPSRRTIGFNKVATGCLALTSSHCLLNVATHLRRLAVDWDRAVVVVSGQMERPTAALTPFTNPYCALLRHVSDGRLRHDRILFAPYAETRLHALLPQVVENPQVVDEALRRLAYPLLSQAAVAARMYDDYPSYLPALCVESPLHRGQSSVSAPPRITDPTDWYTWGTRLRVAMEDPQLLGCSAVASYILEELIANDMDPVSAELPGVDEDYPAAA